MRRFRKRYAGLSNRIATLIAVVLALLTSGGAIAAIESVNTEYVIMHLIRMPSLYWIDDDQVLFAGIRKKDIQAALAAKEVDRGERLKKLYIWDDKKKVARFYSDSPEVCFTQGFITYPVRSVSAGGKRTVREGKIGSEKEVEKPLPPEESVHSSFTCRTHARESLVPPAPRFRRVAILRDGDGYIDFGPGGGKDLIAQRRAPGRNIVLYQAATGKAIQLPFTWDENFSVSEIAYSIVRGAYVVQPHSPVGIPIGTNREWPKGQPLTVYLVWPDGGVETISLPYAPVERALFPRPTRDGWIYGGGRSRAVGLYLLEGKSVIKIDVGLVHEIAIAPNGCKAAVAIQNNPFEMGTPTNLKIFNLCARER